MVTTNMNRRLFLAVSGGAGLVLATGCGEAPEEEPGDVGCVDGLPGHANSVTGNAYGHDHARIALSPDGALLAGGGRHRSDLLVWDTATGEVVHSFEVGTVVRPVWLGATVLCWATDQAIVIADLVADEVRHFLTPKSSVEGGDAPQPQVYSLSASPDGARVAFLESADFLVVADVDGCSALEPHRLPGARAVGMTGSNVVVESAEEVFVVEPSTGERAGEFGPGSAFAPMVWAADASALAVEANAGFATETRVISPATGELLAVAAGELTGMPLAFSPDGVMLVGRHEDGTLKVWEHATSAVATVDPQQGVSDVATADGVLYVWGPDALDAWDVAGAGVIRTFSLR